MGGWNLFFLPQISYFYHKFNCLKLGIKEVLAQPSWFAVCPINFTVCFRELLYFNALGCCRIVISWVSSVVLAGISTSCWCWNNKDYKENVEMCFKQFLWMLTERKFRVWSCLECTRVKLEFSKWIYLQDGNLDGYKMGKWTFSMWLFS